MMADKFEAVARRFSEDMGVALSGWRLRRNYELEHCDIRSAAVASVDGCHGYTCEFAPSYDQHVAEYDHLEQLLMEALGHHQQKIGQRYG
jgi:glucose-6-phosphate isomerase